MSPRTLRNVLLSLLAVTCSLILSLTLGLERLAVLPGGIASGVNIWGILAPLLASVAGGAVVLRGNRLLREGVPPARLANLPGRFLLVYLLVAGVVAAVGAALEPHPLRDLRPYVTFLGSPTLVVTHLLALRAFIVPPWTAELTRLATRRDEEDKPTTVRKDRRSLHGVGVLAISPALTLFAAVSTMVALSLIGLHIHSIALSSEERQVATHLADLLRVTQAQIGVLPPDRVRPFVAGYPSGGYGAPILIDTSSGRTLTETPGLPAGAALTVTAGRCVGAGRPPIPCAAGPADPGSGRRLVVIKPPALSSPNTSLSSLGTHLLLVALALFFFAGLLGRAIGKDISRDFAQITGQLRAMSRKDDLDLGRAVTVTSIDEVGDLTSYLGRLRTRLESEHEAYQDALRQTREADRIKNEFFSDVSRELRTPLTTLCGYSQLLIEQSPGPLNATQLKDVDSIHRGGLQLLGLVNDVLDISVIESGFLKLNPERIDVGALCGELYRGQLSALTASRASNPRAERVELQLEVAEGLPQINADPRRLQQVVQNLLSNAMKFTEQGSVTLRVERADPPEDGICIEIADTGVGIDASDMLDVFDHYHQAGDLNMRRKGSGLGLAISKHLVELHGGRIAVRSVVHRGSTFTVILPLDAVSSASGRHLSAPLPATAGAA